MYLITPDPYPGRCLNHRLDVASMSQVRCLDYEGTRHVCRFPKIHAPSKDVQYSTSIYSNTKPKPWVAPHED